MSAKRRASAARRWYSSIKGLPCSTVMSASPFSLVYGRASEAEAEGHWVGDQNQSPTCGALEPHTRQTPTDNEFTRPRGSVPSAGRSGDHPSHNRLGSWALLGRGLMTGSAPYE